MTRPQTGSKLSLANYKSDQFPQGLYQPIKISVIIPEMRRNAQRTRALR